VTFAKILVVSIIMFVYFYRHTPLRVTVFRTAGEVLTNT
jgi:hypothetical protein